KGVQAMGSVSVCISHHTASRRAAIFSDVLPAWWIDRRYRSRADPEHLEGLGVGWFSVRHRDRGGGHLVFAQTDLAPSRVRTMVVPARSGADFHLCAFGSGKRSPHVLSIRRPGAQRYVADRTVDL